SGALQVLQPSRATCNRPRPKRGQKAPKTATLDLRVALLQAWHCNMQQAPGRAGGQFGPVSQAGEACQSRESVFQQARTSASSAAAGDSKASGDCIAHNVAPLIAHQSSGTTRSSQCVRSAAMRTPSVATTVGSGAMPKISACSHGRPSSRPTSGQTNNAKT